LVKGFVELGFHAENLLFYHVMQRIQGFTELYFGLKSC